jgi:WD40 repeat protein
VRQLAWAPDGSWLAALDHPKKKAPYRDTTGRLHVWQVPTGKRLAEHKNLGEVHGIAASVDGRTLFAAGPDAAVTAWDTATWKERERYDFGIGPVQAVAVAPDGSVAAAGGEAGRVVLWDVGAS